jgi:hypothetical protein
MSIRSLAMLVFTLVAGVAVSVDLYLDGEREVRAEIRTERAEHLPRMLSDSAPALHRAPLKSRKGTSSSTVPTSRATAMWLPRVEGESSSTALDPR